MDPFREASLVIYTWGEWSVDDPAWHPGLSGGGTLSPSVHWAGALSGCLARPVTFHLLFCFLCFWKGFILQSPTSYPPHMGCPLQRLLVSRTPSERPGP